MVRTNRNIKLYSKIVVAWLSDFVARRTNTTDATYELITDEVRHHYQVVRTGFLEVDEFADPYCSPGGGGTHAPGTAHAIE